MLICSGQEVSARGNPLLFEPWKWGKCLLLKHNLGHLDQSVLFLGFLFHSSHLCKSRLTLGLVFQHVSHVFCHLSQIPWYLSPTSPEITSASLRDPKFPQPVSILRMQTPAALALASRVHLFVPGSRSNPASVSGWEPVSSSGLSQLTSLNHRGNVFPSRQRERNGSAFL